MNGRHLELLWLLRGGRRRAVRLVLLLMLLTATLASSVSYAQEGGQGPIAEAPQVEDLPPNPEADNQGAAPHPDAEKVVHIAEVTVESDEDVTTLQGFGFACPAPGLCEIEATEPQLSALRKAGLAVDVVGIVAEWSQEDGLELAYLYGANFTDITILQGYASVSTIKFTAAPSGAKVGRVKYDCQVVASGSSGGPGDYRLNIRPGESGPGYDIWNRQGGFTDGGHDDDTADDRDIYLWQRNLYSALDGHAVNQTWRLTAQDYVVSPGGSGKIDYWKLWVYYCPSDPTAPSLTVPFNTAHICDTTPTFDWVSVLGATSYNIAVDDSSSFSSPAIYTQVTGSDFTVPASHALARKTWYWRVRAHNDCTWGPWSAVRSFTIDSVPGTSSLLQPAYDSHTCDSTPTFHWTTASGATSYGIQVDDSVTFSTPVVDNIVGTTTYTPAAPIAPGFYYWRVRGRSACGNGAWTSGRFYIDPPLPAPGGPSPANGATGVATSANLDWTSVPGATSYDVYFGTAASPPLLGNVTPSAYALPTLSGGTKYYWKIVAKKPTCSTSGPLWSFTTASSANQSPDNVSLWPDHGSRLAGRRVNFTATYRDRDGWRDLRQVYLHIGPTTASAGNVMLRYDRQKNKLYMNNNAGTAWIGGCAPGSPAVIRNRKGTLNCAKSTVTRSGRIVKVKFNMLFRAAFRGQKKTYMKCTDRSGAVAPWEQMGTWRVQ